MLLQETVSPLFWAEKYKLEQQQLPARHVLLREGSKATTIYFIREGCLRIWMNHKGNEITNQFFFEGSVVASMESILTGQPSDFFVETIEKSTVFLLDKKRFEALLAADTAFSEWFHQYILRRFLYYSKHLLSYLKERPEERYLQLTEQQPHIIRRIPQHYISSYLGITPVSLSRIRNKLLKQPGK